MNHRIIACAVAALCVLLTASVAHAAKFETPEARLKYVKKKGGYSSLQQAFNCKDIALQYQTTEMEGGNPFDTYIATGCGAQTLFVATAYTRKLNGTVFTTWFSSVAAPDADFETVAISQLQKTASFDLGCKDAQFSVLHALRTPLHNEYRATIGASGCEKKLTYETTCAIKGVKDGKAEIVCMGTANASPSAQ